jgi:hypothetical protein
VEVHNETIKFQNIHYYSNTTNAVYRGRTGLLRENVHLYDVQISACLVYAHEDYNCFAEVYFFVVTKVSKWNIEQGLNFVQMKDSNY